MTASERCLAYICSLIIILSLSAPTAADTKPVPIKKGDKCQVCGMFVSPYPTWAAEIVFKDGSYAVFDGPKDMFKYYLNIGKFNPAKRQSDISALYVTEYYSTGMVNANDIFFVRGSDVEGPMGNELVPVGSEEKAKVFMKDHRGKKILKYKEVRMEDLK